MSEWGFRHLTSRLRHGLCPNPSEGDPTRALAIRSHTACRFSHVGWGSSLQWQEGPTAGSDDPCFTPLSGAHSVDHRDVPRNASPSVIGLAKPQGETRRISKSLVSFHQGRRSLLIGGVPALAGARPYPPLFPAACVVPGIEQAVSHEGHSGENVGGLSRGAGRIGRAGPSAVPDICALQNRPLHLTWEAR
jgi:hypothetical protein